MQEYCSLAALPLTFAWSRNGLETNAYATGTSCRNIIDQSDCSNSNHTLTSQSSQKGQ